MTTPGPSRHPRLRASELRQDPAMDQRRRGDAWRGPSSTIQSPVNDGPPRAPIARIGAGYRLAGVAIQHDRSVGPRSAVAPSWAHPCPRLAYPSRTGYTRGLRDAVPLSNRIRFDPEACRRSTHGWLAKEFSPGSSVGLLRRVTPKLALGEASASAGGCDHTSRSGRDCGRRRCWRKNN